MHTVSLNRWGLWIALAVCVACGAAGGQDGGATDTDSGTATDPATGQGTSAATESSTVADAEGSTSEGTEGSTGQDTDPSDACAGLATLAAPSVSLVSSEPPIFNTDSTFSLVPTEAFSTEIEVIRDSVVVWRAVVDEASTSVALADGEFLVPGDAALVQWKKHTARARAFDGTCPRSGWSESTEFRSDDGSYDLFGQNDPLDVVITLSDESYAAIAAQANPEGQSYPFSRDYHSADVSLNGTPFTGAGARVKGSGTARTLDEKAAFKIHLSWDDPDVPGCAEENRFHGLKRITLNNMVQDDTYLHETLAYQFYGALGITVPRTQFANLTINGEHFGFYLHVESVDRRFLARRFLSRKGMLYEAIYGGGRNCDLSPEKLGAAAEDNCFEASFSTDRCDGDTTDYDATDHSHLHRLAEQIEAIPPGELYDQLGELMDVDGYLAHFAGEIVVGAGDSHFYHWNNYRLYHEPSDDRWYTLPTGIDTSFSAWLPPDTVGSEPVAYLAQRCLDEDPCRARLIEIIEDALDTFDSMDFEGRMDALITQIEEGVANDTRAEASAAEVESARNSMRSFVQSRRETVEELVATWSAG